MQSIPEIYGIICFIVNHANMHKYEYFCTLKAKR